MSAAFQIIEKQITESTNDDARALILAGIADNTVIIAEEQTKGRGRQQREWVSRRGNLFCSFIVHPQQDIKDFPFYSFMMALSVLDAVQHFLPAAKVQVKWPNDILVDEKKIAGLLLEIEGNALIIGVGINCVSAPDNTTFPATHFLQENTKLSPKECLTKLCEDFSYWHAVFDQDGFDPIRASWKNHAFRWQQEIAVRRKNSHIQGKLIDLAADGALILETPDGLQRITAGDVWM